MQARWLGATVALLICLGSGYEFLAIVHPAVPTISRVVQGWRDLGDWWGFLALSVTFAMVGALLIFTRWLWYHLRRDRRSPL
jgi:hypothetical protein